MTFLGHSANDNGKGVTELLRDHIQAVTDRAAGFAAAFGAAEQARIAGLLHDLGKYADQFQRRLRGEGAGRDHSIQGALACIHYYKRAGLIPALAILAHHIGLQDAPVSQIEFQNALSSRILDPDAKNKITETDVKLLLQRFTSAGFTFPPRPASASALKLTNTLSIADQLDIRMLFSCLVDADSLETEAHFEGDAGTPRRPRTPGPALDLPHAIARLDEHVGAFGPPANALQHARGTLFNACVHAAALPTGQFTLTAPTGTGKTLAMLAFALHHAQAHGLRRIVLVMPFLNIIEQTARIYHDLFSIKNKFQPHTVLEHHGLAHETGSAVPDLEGRENKPSLRERLAENWDAPIILTTSIQCLESLFANKRSDCRKLHRLAGSVILFDEVQTLPPHLAKVTLAALSRLTDPAGPYRSSVVFATATQPAFDAFDPHVRAFSSAGWNPREINTHSPDMFTIAAGRITTRWRHRKPTSVEALATQLAGHEQALCIVNLKRHAIDVAKALADKSDSESVLHLSTNMCAAHRLETLQTVRARLTSRRPVRLIATQCIEAGVDVSFPHVYRALAPMDSICQAAGRCNRHGELSLPGSFTVFEIEDEKSTFPPGYGAGVGATKSILEELAKDHDLDAIELLNDPARLRAYYTRLYGLTGRDAAKEIADEAELLRAVGAYNFPNIAQQYKLINSDTVNVLVPFDRKIFDELVRETEAGFQDSAARRKWRRRAAALSVSVYRNDKNPVWSHLIGVDFFNAGDKLTTADCDWFYVTDSVDYDRFTGLQSPEGGWIV